MADETKITFTLSGDDAANRNAWRAQPPRVLSDAGYKLKDESYDTLVYEANVTTTTMKIMMFGFAKTLYRLAVTFRPEGEVNTAVTMIGQAQRQVREELARLGSGR
ncbi:MAG: hypothetical protein WD271_01625 [Acidimicrobiia bacterium]